MLDIRSFGRAFDKDIPLICLSNGCTEVQLIPIGAAIRSLLVPDRNGVPTDVCLGYDSPEDYLNHGAYMGATVGRCANRIGNARFRLGGRQYTLSANDGKNHLHGGADGFSKKLWSFSPLSDSAVRFSLFSPAGDEGYPGNLSVEVTYTVSECDLLIDFFATTDADTVVNLTNHTYFNLAGHDEGFISDHALAVNSHMYTPTDAGNIPTGELLPVRDTALDLRNAALLGERLECDALRRTGGFDHNYVLNDSYAARLHCLRTGITMSLRTTLPGMQVYTSGVLSQMPGKGGAVYGRRCAICLEPQFFPDAVNKPSFQSPVLRAGEEYRHCIRYMFSAE